MKKTIKIGLSAMMAFAFMFATSLGVIAQENTVAPTDKSEVEFVEAKILAGTLQKLNDELSQKTKMSKEKEIPVKKLSAQWYMQVSGDGSQPSHYQPYQPGPTDPDEPTCLDGEEVCAVFALPGANPDQPDATELARILSENPPGTPDNPNEIRFKN